MKTWRATRPFLLALAVVAILAVTFFAFFDWNLLRGVVNDRVSSRLGRAFAIEGNLDVQFFPTRIRAERVVLANAEWGSEPRMVVIEMLVFQLSLSDLLHRRVVIPELELHRPWVLLERGPHGSANWQLPGLAAGDDGQAATIGRVSIQEGRLRYRYPAVGTDIRARVDTQNVAGNAAGERTEPEIVLRADGRFHGERFVARARGGSLIAFRDPTDPYPIDVDVRIGGTRLAAKGRLSNPLQLAGADAGFLISGPDLERLEPVVRIKLPPTPPYRLEGRLDHAPGVWTFRGFDGEVGDSHLSGNFTLDFRGDRPAVRADLVSRRLELEDLSGFVGGRAGEGLIETGKKTGRVFPDKTFDLPPLQAMDADVSFRGQPVVAAPLRLDELFTQLTVRDGVLSLDPIRFRIIGGSISGAVRLDARPSPARWNFDLTVRNLDLDSLLPDLERVATTKAHMGGRFRLTSWGNSIAGMLANANGDAGLVATDAEISKLLVSLANLDIVRTITSFFGQNDKVPMRCAVADFDVKQGRMHSETFLIDTTQADFFVEGEIALGKEQLDLTVHSVPEGPTLSLRAPLSVTGSFLDPEVSVEGGALVKGATAFGLAALAPLAALVPLVDLGEEAEHPCDALMGRVRESGGQEKETDRKKR